MDDEISKNLLTRNPKYSTNFSNSIKKTSKIKPKEVDSMTKNIGLQTEELLVQKSNNLSL